MAEPRVAIVGAGPAGIRAAEALVAAGLRPALIDESSTSGGQIYRRQPRGFRRSYRTLYGFEAAKARAIHQAFDNLKEHIDYRPDTLVWNVAGKTLHLVRDGHAETLDCDALILATGATDRLLPLRGWTLPGCYTLGAAQIALKAQACAIGRRVVFLGTGPLLYLISYQYAQAGIDVAAVLDTSPLSAQLRALPIMASRPATLLKGLYYRAQLMRYGVPVHTSVNPVAVTGEDSVTGVRFRTAGGQDHVIDADAVGMGFHLRSEMQLADLAQCEFSFDTSLDQWAADTDEDGRSSTAGVYLAGDGHRILGADGAEACGELAALAVLSDLRRPVDRGRVRALRRKRRRMEYFRNGLALAFPWPASIARALEDDVLLCRCEAITVGELRATVTEQGAPELNRAKALTRVGMGRCQGRYCGQAAAEILSEAAGVPLLNAGRLRGQAPVKPLSMQVRPGDGQ